MRGAGTDADVRITLEGACGRSSNRILLDTYGDNFERGDCDSFTITMPGEMGDLCRLKVRHDDSGAGSGWFLDSIKVRNLDNNQVWLFNCNDWLATDEGDCCIYRTLTAE